MAIVTERSLRNRLARVEALERGATTEGERQAAALARERLRLRIAKVRAQDPVARFVAAHVAALGVQPPRPQPPARLPSVARLLAVLGQWGDGDLARQDVQAWAETVVDRVVLPSDPDHRDAAIAEVLLQLAMLHRVALQPGDLPRIQGFLEDRDWSAWFALVAEASERRSPRR